MLANLVYEGLAESVAGALDSATVEPELSVRHSVRARLRELIAVSRSGSRLPSERILSSRWGVARMTVRNALDDLVREGLIERRHGSGTYVAPHAFARFLGLTSATQDMAAGTGRMTEPRASAGRRYLELAGNLVERLLDGEWPNIDRAADLVAESLARGGTIHAFGTGHSHVLAEELYYRAGGFVRVNPILFEGLMLHSSALLSTSLERMPGLAEALLADHPIASGDVLVVASNSGRNAVTAELAQATRAAGASVIAVTSLRHATAQEARTQGLPRLHEVADVVIDNGGIVGDAAIDIDGFDVRVAPTSTLVGAAILNAMTAEAVERLVKRGTPPEIYTSSNVEGGDAANARYRSRGSGSVK